MPGASSSPSPSITPTPTPTPTPDPLNILTNVTLWYDLQDATKVTVTGGKVAALTDKSTAGNNASQGTDAARPTYNATGINGFPCMSSAGGGTIGLVMSATAIRVPSSVFVVVEKDTDFQGMIISKAGSVFGAVYNINSYLLSYNSDTPGEIQSSTGTTDLTPAFLQYNITAVDGTGQLYINNSALTMAINSGWPSGTQAGYVYLMGPVGVRDYKGKIGEVIISDIPNTTQRNALYNNYIKSRWSLP